MAPAGAAPAPAPPEDVDPRAQSVNPAAALETLPPAVLDIPAVFAVAKGQPAAVSAPDESPDPAVKAITKNAQALVAAGFGIYETRDKKNWVLYNSQLVHPGDLLEADSQGTLGDVAPPFNTIGGQPAPAGAAPAGSATPAPTDQGPAPTPASQPAASVQTNLAVKRQANITPGSPTSGPKPGAGRILNSILKPAV